MQSARLVHLDINIRLHRAAPAAAGGRYNHNRYNIQCTYLPRIIYVYILIIYVPIGIPFILSQRLHRERRRTSRSRQVVLDDRIAYIIYTSLRACI